MQGVTPHDEKNLSLCLSFNYLGSRILEQKRGGGARLFSRMITSVKETHGLKDTTGRFIGWRFKVYGRGLGDVLMYGTTHYSCSAIGYPRYLNVEDSLKICSVKLYTCGPHHSLLERKVNVSSIS